MECGGEGNGRREMGLELGGRRERKKVGIEGVVWVGARVTRVCGRVGSGGCWSTGRIRGGLTGGGVGKQVDFVFSSWDDWCFWFWDSLVWRTGLLVLVFGTQELFWFACQRN